MSNRDGEKKYERDERREEKEERREESGSHVPRGCHVST